MLRRLRLVLIFVAMGIFVADFVRTGDVRAMGLVLFAAAHGLAEI